MKSTQRKTRGKPQTLRLHPETVVAVEDMMRWLEQKSGGSLWYSARGRLSRLNWIIRAACEAVVNMEPPPPPSGVNDLAYKACVCWPLAFDARRETREEREFRVMLDQAFSSEDGERGSL